jgi:hypothetical protein
MSSGAMHQRKHATLPGGLQPPFSDLVLDKSDISNEEKSMKISIKSCVFKSVFIYCFYLG